MGLFGAPYTDATSRISDCPGRLNEMNKGGAWLRYLQLTYLRSNESRVVEVKL